MSESLFTFGNLLPALIATPAVLALVLAVLPKSWTWKGPLFSMLSTLACLAGSIAVFGKTVSFKTGWGGFGIDFSLASDNFSTFILCAVSVFSFLIALYSIKFLKGKGYASKVFMYIMLTASFANGVVLSRNLVCMLFFWEGLLLMLFVFIMAGNRQAFKTSVKAFIIVGVSDLCFMLGIAMTGFLAGTLEMDKINISLESWGIFAFVLMFIGAAAKAGSMPFHSWIPDAASDAPLPFMALLPGALEKLLGIYLLGRITIEMFDLKAGTPMSTLLMCVGAFTIVFAVLMALIQKDFKKLLSYHAISQVGYMVLGIGTALPIGIIGGLFHMINNAMYKSCLFLAGGSVERQAGTTDLRKIGGLGRKMPVTFFCFTVAALSISGVPPFNGFYSKELVFDAALESGWVFYAAALLGAFMTAASFLKLGHSAFLGKTRMEGKDYENVRESPWQILSPMIIIALGCIFFGLWNYIPLRNLIQPVLGAAAEGHDFSGVLPHNWILAGASAAILLLALLNHFYGVRKSGGGLGAVDHIHHAPGLSTVYDMAEKRYFDPYDIGMVIVNAASKGLYYIDRGIDWFYNHIPGAFASALSFVFRKPQTGRHGTYVAYTAFGIIAILIYTIVAFGISI